MGSDNSGRQTERLTVEDCVSLSTADLLRFGFLPSCNYGLVNWYSAFGGLRYSIHVSVSRAGDRLLLNLWGTGQRVTLEATPLHFGGCRWWFRCPSCERRCAGLYLPPQGNAFACRACYGLAYESSRLHRGFGGLAMILSRKKGRWVSQAEVERACMQIRRQQRLRWMRKRDRRPDFKPRDWRLQEMKKQAGTLLLGEG